MLAKLKTIYQFIQPYLIVVAVYWTALCGFKLIDTIIFFCQHDIHFFQVFYPHAVVNLIVNATYALLGLPLYAIIRTCSKKSAVITSAILFSTLLIFDIGLTIYSYSTGALLDSELIIRPFKEELLTIHATFRLWLAIPLILITIISITWTAWKCSQYSWPKWLTASVLIIILIGTPCITTIPKLISANPTPKVNNYIVNKSWFCFQSCCDYLQQRLSDAAFFHKTIHIPAKPFQLKQFINDQTDWQVTDITFPLERKNNIPDVLSPYFDFQPQKPNIVIIIVESLGQEWNEGICFAPFIDSLSKNSLYWRNCMSTTSRSFGAVPAITSSVPCGRKGFQFGNIPNHLSLISILRENGYQTNNFYGGDFAFDCILDYLAAQDPDFISPYFSEYKKDKNPQMGNWWGFHDHVLFDHAIRYCSTQKNEQPRMDLLITISSHENLNLGDKKNQQYYVQKTQKIISQSSEKMQRRWSAHVERAAGIVYADDCLRQFIQQYRQLPGGENTIFVITGDHASGVISDDCLSFYRVPLIIWSPMLKAAKTFPALVTHNDITPSIVAMLSAHGFITPPEVVHWIGRELDVADTFRSKSRMLIIDYSHEIADMIYDQYLYHNLARLNDEKLYRIKDHLKTEPIDNQSLQSKLHKKMDLYKYVNEYVYHNNRLSQYNTHRSALYIPIYEYNSSKNIRCLNPKEPPSKKSFATYYLMHPHSIPNNQNWKKIRLTFQAEVKIMDSLWQDQNKNLILSCEGDNMKYSTKYKDKIIKFITCENFFKGQWYPVNISKVFIVEGASNLSATISVNTPEYDELWIPDCEMNVRNIRVSIEGIPQ